MFFSRTVLPKAIFEFIFLRIFHSWISQKMKSFLYKNFRHFLEHDFLSPAPLVKEFFPRNFLFLSDNPPQPTTPSSCKIHLNSFVISGLRIFLEILDLLEMVYMTANLSDCMFEQVTSKTCF